VADGPFPPAATTDQETRMDLPTREPLPPLPQTPRDYQIDCFGDALRWLDDEARHSQTNRSRLYTAPCGSGKSFMILSVASFLDGMGVPRVVTTPRLEIVAGMLKTTGVDPATVDGYSDDRLAHEAAKYGIFTPMRLANLMAAGLLPYRPRVWLVDEVHHAWAETYKRLRAYMGPQVVRLGFSGCGFRGSPAETREFLKDWGDEVNQVLDVREAAERGIVAIPRAEVWPLIDDDFVTVKNGQFEVDSASRYALNVVDALHDRIVGKNWVQSLYDTDPMNPDRVTKLGRYWDKSTLFAFPSTDSCHAAASALTAAGIPVHPVTQETPRATRSHFFAGFRERRWAIAQIDVVSEGVDLPVGRIVDLKPTLSPVRALQQWGRLRVEGGDAPELIVCNRNLERFCYLYDGCLPPAAARMTEEAFENADPNVEATYASIRPKNARLRAAARAVGMTDIGRFAAGRVHYSDGCVGFVYTLVRVTEFKREEFAILGHPRFEELLYAARESARKADTTVTWGRWRRADDVPGDFKGWQSAPAKKITPKMTAWWRRDAQRLGLDFTVDPNVREFAALPVLKDVGGKPKSWLEGVR
jgi:superfamily II DNA or RNA helicase